MFKLNVNVLSTSKSSYKISEPFSIKCPPRPPSNAICHLYSRCIVSWALSYVQGGGGGGVTFGGKFVVLITPLNTSFICTSALPRINNQKLYNLDQVQYKTRKARKVRKAQNQFSELSELSDFVHGHITYPYPSFENFYLLYISMYIYSFCYFYFLCVFFVLFNGLLYTL